MWLKWSLDDFAGLGWHNEYKQEKDGISLNNKRQWFFSEFPSGSQWDWRVDGESKQLAIKRNVPKWESKCLGPSHLLSPFKDVRVL